MRPASLSALWEAAPAGPFAEELGLDHTPGRLLVVDWVPAQPDGRPPLADFLFDGGAVTEDWPAANVVLQQAELAEWRLADASHREALLVPRLARRLRVCAEVLAGGAARYLHHGREPHL